MQSKNKYFEYAVYMCNMQVLITKWYMYNQSNFKKYIFFVN